MAAQDVEHEIVLYDLASTKNVCFSPVVWRIRMMLNYKKIPYKTVFLEMPDIEPTLKEFTGNTKNYTVPAIYHVPTNKYVMDSPAVAKFIETTYPDPPVQLDSELGTQIMRKLRSGFGPTLQKSLMPREALIFSPRAEEFFRSAREARAGRPLEELLEGEDEAWAALESDKPAIDALIRTNKADGPFVLGARPSLVDFFIAGAIQTAKVIDEGVFQRITKVPGHLEIYEACQPFMQKKD
ncbi:glutathione S-transferase-like protein ustS [Trichoderma asperellum]|uniref:Glutathione S-transferase-like protein ustS n=1 Tax=Trichoderma asperellum TaxID=101201 RepID=A0A6V8QRL5_TRIAP|nr:glutathione S-transferase-like protein ustS [Trichoderma asperellum]